MGCHTSKSQKKTDLSQQLKYVDKDYQKNIKITEPTPNFSSIESNNNNIPQISLCKAIKKLNQDEEQLDLIKAKLVNLIEKMTKQGQNNINEEDIKFINQMKQELVEYSYLPNLQLAQLYGHYIYTQTEQQKSELFPEYKPLIINFSLSPSKSNSSTNIQNLNVNLPQLDIKKNHSFSHFQNNQGNEQKQQFTLEQNYKYNNNLLLRRQKQIQKKNEQQIKINKN